MTDTSDEVADLIGGISPLEYRLAIRTDAEDFMFEAGEWSAIGMTDDSEDLVVQKMSGGYMYFRSGCWKVIETIRVAE